MIALHSLLFVFLLFTNIQSSQLPLQKDTDNRVKQDSIFPGSWAGIWTGDLDIYNANGLQQSVPMELHILPIDTSDQYSWHIIYGEDKVKGLRPYVLVTDDLEKGHYIVDEKNSILLDNYLLGGELVSVFDVMNSLIITSVRKEGDHLVYKIMAGKTDPIRSSGNEVFEGDSIPEVNSYKMQALQMAILSKQ